MDAGWNGKDETDYGVTVGFTGRELDLDSGVWGFRSRWYSSECAEFLTRDLNYYRISESFDLSFFRY